MMMLTNLLIGPTWSMKYQANYKVDISTNSLKIKSSRLKIKEQAQEITFQDI